MVVKMHQKAPHDEKILPTCVMVMNSNVGVWGRLRRARSKLITLVDGLSTIPNNWSFTAKALLSWKFVARDKNSRVALVMRRGPCKHVNNTHRLVKDLNMVRSYGAHPATAMLGTGTTRTLSERCRRGFQQIHTINSTSV